MFTKKSIFRMFLVLLVVVIMSSTASARPLEAALGTGFTYQGRLTNSGLPANGTYDLEFKLYDALSGGAQVGSTVTKDDVTVTAGLFTVQLDFGNVFDGTALYLQIGVRPGASVGAYTPLTPRQQLTATPYALYAMQAYNADLLDGQQATYYQNASNINSGTLGANYYSAYADLGVEGYLGNAANDLALNNGTLQDSLNADFLDGKTGSYYAIAAHNHWGQTWIGSGTGLTLSGGTTGLSGSGSDYGVYGSGNYTGVYGLGDSYGIYGTGSYGVVGSSNGSGSIGVWGGSAGGPDTNYAGYFFGNVYIQGSLTATGGKSAAVETQDYGTRALYAVESPEVWFEDFGTGQMTNGEAVITIDPVFAETVNLADDYHVFLTPLGDCALYVKEKSPTSFTVRAMGGQTCSISFDYRIVAKRLGYEDVRLAEITDTEPLPPPEGGAK
jgi:hypothetical protein